MQMLKILKISAYLWCFFPSLSSNGDTLVGKIAICNATQYIVYPSLTPGIGGVTQHSLGGENLLGLTTDQALVAIST